MQGMESKIIDGRKLAERRTEILWEKVACLPFKPKIVSVIVGNDPASLLYTQIKKRKAKEVGINFQPMYFGFPPVKWEAVIKEIEELNDDQAVTGILVQLPLPEDFLDGKSEEELLNKIDPRKDIDGLTINSPFLPAVVRAVLGILEEEKITVDGKKAVVVGASNLVGRPLAKELERMGAKVTVCDERTADLREQTLQAQILVSAAGAPGLIKENMVSGGVMVIDVGTNKVGDKVVGDVDFASVLPKASKITPVPGGVGPMTVVSLLENVVKLGE